MGVRIRGWSSTQSSEGGRESAFAFFAKDMLALEVLFASGVERLVRDDSDLSSASREGMESEEVDREVISSCLLGSSSSGLSRSSLDSSANSNNMVMDWWLPKVGSVTSCLHCCTSSSIDIRLDWLSLFRPLTCLDFGGGIAVTASRAATEGGRASRWCAWTGP